jgi:hypothetical protein
MKRYIFVIIIISAMKSNCQEVKIDYSWPPLIAGTSFGNLFQQLYKQGDYPTMLKLTSDESITKFSADTILLYYHLMDFGFPLKLKSWTRDSGYFNLNYNSTIQATSIIVRMKLFEGSKTREGDTAKLVLPDDFKTQKYFLYK